MYGVALNIRQLRQLAVDALDELYQKQLPSPSYRNTLDYALLRSPIGPTTYAQYKEEMCIPCEDGGTRWGDHHVLIALAYALGCEVSTWNAQTRNRCSHIPTNSLVSSQLTARLHGASGAHLHLKYYEMVHYEPLLLVAGCHGWPRSTGLSLIAVHVWAGLPSLPPLIISLQLLS